MFKSEGNLPEPFGSSLRIQTRESFCDSLSEKITSRTTQGIFLFEWIGLLNYFYFTTIWIESSESQKWINNRLEWWKKLPYRDTVKEVTTEKLTKCDYVTAYTKISLTGWYRSSLDQANIHSCECENIVTFSFPPQHCYITGGTWEG